MVLVLNISRTETNIKATIVWVSFMVKAVTAGQMVLTTQGSLKMG